MIDVDILIVGAGPTGLTLAAQLHSFGIRFRLIDKTLDRAHESRALAVQARSLEILQSLTLGDALVARGNASARLMLHFEGRVSPPVQLGGFAAADTRYPFILFVSQAETEALLGEHLTGHGVAIERGIELVDFDMHTTGVDCVLRDGNAHEERLRCRFLVGCDGPHSTVRKGAGIAFEGDAYLQDFMLGDVEADAQDGTLPPNTLHSFGGRHGIAMFFPLGRPTTWRVIAMAGDAAGKRPTGPAAAEKPMEGDLSLGELQAVVDGATGGAVRLRDPAWLTHFRLHHRQALQYRRDRVFLAGDAGHIHSPVGAQGMNTGIQDAWNLGWKLALVTLGAADAKLLDTYEAERWPVGRALLRYTDRIFSVLVRSLSASKVAAWIRRTVVAPIIPRVLRSERVRGWAFRFVSELGINYRSSAAVREGTPRLRAGPRAGDRLPDAQVTRDGRTVYLHNEVAGPRYHLLLCGPLTAWHPSQLERVTEPYAGLVAVRYLTNQSAPNVLVDAAGETLKRLGVTSAAQYLVRPDGYVAFRSAGADLTGLHAYLQSWLVRHDQQTQRATGAGSMNSSST